MAAKKVICDTDVMIDYWKSMNPRHSETKTILENAIGIENVVLSAITKMELLIGAINKVDLLKMGKNINPLIIALIDTEITLMALSLIEKYSLSHKLSIPDSVIAATAIVTGLELFTYNTKDYKFIPGIILYS